MCKPLSEYTLEELWTLFPIELKKYDKIYKNQYNKEIKEIKNILFDNIVRINHIGSTSVDGLISKPIVDILLEISNDTDIVKLTDTLCNNGWILMSKQNEPFQQFSFNKGYTPKGFDSEVYHLHIRHAGDWDELYFRDYLIEHTSVANDYGQLKKMLIKKYKYNRDAYTKEKTNFILRNTKLARKEFSDRYKLD